MLATFISVSPVATTQPHSAMAADRAPTKATPAEKKVRVSKPRIEKLLQHAQANDYSTHYGIFADLHLNSGKKRLFVVDFRNHAIVKEALVTHGHCKENKDGVRFSNVPNTNCSSEGKYRIGKSYYGIFGLAYKLHGLDPTNSNAYKRHIVLHAHECVFDQTWPTEICESEGCPTVSPNVLSYLKKLIDSEPKPMLLWIYH